MTLTPKQEKFAQLYVEIGNASEAYRQAYDSKAKPAACERTGYYVYFLCDLRDGKVFYVGKGKGDRIRRHAKFAGRDARGNRGKDKKILEIEKSGLLVDEVILEWFGDNEEAALCREFELIVALREFGITNISNGRNPRESVAVKEAELMLKSMPSSSKIMSHGNKEQILAVERHFGSVDNYVSKMNEILNSVIEGRCHA